MSQELVPAGDPVARAYQSMLVGFDTSMGTSIRRNAIPVLQALPTLLPPGERLLAFVQARKTSPAKDNVVLAATSSRLMAFRDDDHQLVFDAPRDDVEVVEFAQDFMSGNRLKLRARGQEAIFKQLLPSPQADRIFALVGGLDERPHRHDLLRQDQPLDPGHPPLAVLWLLALYDDRLIDQDGRHLPFTGGQVMATCDSAGNIAVTRGRDLAAKGVGTLFLGPIGLFGMGNAQHREIDTRELYLLVEGPGWAYTQQFVPDLGGPLRQFAQTINVIAAQHREGSSVPAQKLSEEDPVTRLRELAKLHEEGILTAEEFAAQKARTLDRM